MSSSPNSTGWVIFTDGGSRGNPGQAACAFSVVDLATNDEVFSASRSLGVVTNNEAEYAGLIDSMEYVLKSLQDGRGVKDVVWKLDSKLVVEQVLGRWKVKEPRLQPMALKARQLLVEIQDKLMVGGDRLTHVPREENARADQLVNECLDSV